MGVVRVYKSTDPSSPAHPSNQRGSLIALLRACLVTGYGSGEYFKTPAGWEEPFLQIGNKAAFRSKEGSGQFLQIDEDGADPDVAYARACESMADAETPQGEWGGTYFGKWYNASASQSWVLVADERTFYLFLDSLYGRIPHAFGEFDSLIPADPYNSLLAGHGDSGALEYGSRTALTDWLHADSNSNYGVRFHHSATGAFGAYGSLLTAGTDRPDLYSSPDPAGNGLGWYYLPALLTCDTDNDGGASLVRGRLRGLYHPLAYKPLPEREEWTDPETGRKYLPVNYDADDQYYRGQFLIDITGSWI